MATSARSAPQRDLSQDEVFTILKNPRRRNVIRYLNEHGGTSTVRELTAELAAIENDVAVEELTYSQRKAVYTSLYQTHLPKLDDAGVVDYDQRSGDVELTDHVEACDVHLSVAEGETPTETDDTRLRRFAAVVVGAAHLNLAVMGGWVLATEGLSVSLFGAAGLGVATLLTVAAWAYWHAVMTS